MKTRLAVLLSGRGSNFLAIHKAISDGRLEAEVVAVVSNRPDAVGLDKARELGYPSFAVPHRTCATREEHEEKILRILDQGVPSIICLAGYMRTLTPHFINAFPNRILNIHPSLLPSFPGVDAQKQAMNHGVKISGCTVHLVDASLDGGPILVQRAVPVLEDDDTSSLSSRILVEEHLAYIEALEIVMAGIRVEGGRVVRDSPGEI
ncbi:MAG TPA: phosphoribosylglycinamide formyltransferase [Thermoanaerobaculia bacterium]|nr:phosphoribosylglycinamide formyltransferase [Thermoanaerobaculia bacterium]